jgi:hypothetical protein
VVYANYRAERSVHINQKKLQAAGIIVTQHRIPSMKVCESQEVPEDSFGIFLQR